MRFITANLNGIRSAANKGFFDWLPQQNADAVGVQPALLALTLCYGAIAAYGLSRARALPAESVVPLSTITV